MASEQCRDKKSVPGRERAVPAAHPEPSSLRALQEDLRAAQLQVSRKEVELLDARSKYESMLRSSSWRLTAPLRWLSSTVRRLLGLGPGGPVVPNAAMEEVYPERAGRDLLPPWLLREQDSSARGMHASCRFLNLAPGLQGLLADESLAAVTGVEPAGPRNNLYLGNQKIAPSIGFIGSDELRIELAFDVRVVCVQDDGWQSLLSTANLEFVIIETVWRAGDGSWSHVLTRDGGRQDQLCRFVECCRRYGIAVVLWFRETLSHYDQFSWLVEHADIVCVTDRDVMAEVRRGNPRAGVLGIGPSIQPALHNPLRSYGLMKAADALRKAVVFDGWWDLPNLASWLPSLRSLKSSGLLIAESEWDFGKARLGDAGEFEQHVVGCLSREEKLVMNKLQGAEIFLPGSFAGEWRELQRMYRSAAAGSLVVRLGGAASVIPELGVLPCDEDGDPLACLLRLLANPAAKERSTHLAWRTLTSNHTIAHNLQAMADALGLSTRFVADPPAIACILVSMRPELVPACIQRFRDDLYPAKELIVVVHHDEISLEGFKKLVREGENIRFVRIARGRSLGACLNYAVSLTDAPYWTKMDDDDLYGRNYLTDVMLYQRSGNFPVFGKPPVFSYLEASNELIRGREWAKSANLVHPSASAEANLLAGGTIGGRTSIFEAVRFSERRRGGSDSAFIRDCYAEGLDVMAMDGFNFVRFRSSRPDFHTWQLPDHEIRSQGDVVGGRDDIQGQVFL